MPHHLNLNVQFGGRVITIKSLRSRKYQPNRQGLLEGLTDQCWLVDIFGTLIPAPACSRNGLIPLKNVLCEVFYFFIRSFLDMRVIILIMFIQFFYVSYDNMTKQRQSEQAVFNYPQL